MPAVREFEQSAIMQQEQPGFNNAIVESSSSQHIQHDVDMSDSHNRRLAINPRDIGLEFIGFDPRELESLGFNPMVIDWGPLNEDPIDSYWTDADRIESDWTGLDWIESDRVGPDWIEFDGIGLSLKSLSQIFCWT